MAQTFVGKVGVGKPTVLGSAFSTEKPERRRALDVKPVGDAEVKPADPKSIVKPIDTPPKSRLGGRPNYQGPGTSTKDASPFDVDDDVKSALMILRSKAEGAAAIVKRTGFSKSFVDDVLAGKFGTNEAAIRKAFKADGKAMDAGTPSDWMCGICGVKPGVKFVAKGTPDEYVVCAACAKKDEVMPVGDMSNDMLTKLKAHEASARKIGSIKEADAFLAKIKTVEPNYQPGKGASSSKPNSEKGFQPVRVVETYRKCVIKTSGVHGLFAVTAPDGQRILLDSVQAAKRWVDEVMPGL